MTQIIDTKQIDEKMSEFLAKFPNHAKKWSEATDEIRDMCRIVRETYNDLVINKLEGEPGYIKSLNFRYMATPGEWNSKAKKQIMKLWETMTEGGKIKVARYLF